MMFCALCRPVAPWLHRVLPVAAAAGLSIALVACQPLIEVVQPAQASATAQTPRSAEAASPLAIATVAPAEHNLAVVGVDFDPPLDAARIVSDGGVTLLVAIENQGISAESNVTVTARLLDPQAFADSVPLLFEAVEVKALAPGEVRIVRFPQVTDLPLRSRYQLSVELASVPGEDDVTDNSRAYDIIVREGG
jgi:hypothetical protein